MHLIIGSGPSGLMAAHALLDAGQPVTMVDVGEQLDPSRRDVVAELAALEPEDWDPRSLDAVRGAERLDPALPKLVFGSGFPYAREQASALAQHGTRCLLSHARGGLSNVWGAAVLPSRAEDLVDWPISLDELGPHYEAAARSLRLAAARDDLEALFPFHVEPEPAALPSAQAKRILTRLGDNADALRRVGIRFGQARLAVRTRDTALARGCRYTGRCLAGCPYGAIWNAADEVAALIGRPRFRYLSGVHVVRIESDALYARVIGREVKSGARVQLDGQRVYVAAGSLGTPRLIVDSTGAYGRPCALRFQPYFLLPLLAFDGPQRGEPPLETQRLHTLAQIFLELIDPALSAHTIHLQIYAFNEYMHERLRRLTRFVGPMDAPLRRAVLPHLLAIQAYLHSSEGGAIRLVASAGPTGESARLALDAPDMGPARRLMGRVARRLLGSARLLGVMPIIPMLHAGQPGEGNHLGGIFPMRQRPGELETDRLGCLPRWPRVHIVDASVLPSLPATTFTYTVMANAHRIASEAARLDLSRELSS